MKLFILSIILLAGSVTALPRVRREYDPRTDVSVRVPVEPGFEGEDRVRRHSEPLKDPRASVNSSPETEGEDRVKRDSDTWKHKPVEVAVEEKNAEEEDRVKRAFVLSQVPQRCPGDISRTTNCRG